MNFQREMIKQDRAPVYGLVAVFLRRRVISMALLILFTITVSCLAFNQNLTNIRLPFTKLWEQTGPDHFDVIFLETSGRSTLNTTFIFFSTNVEEMTRRKDTPTIFFLETSNKTELTFREACAVESAALHNPHLTVQLFSLKQFDVQPNSSMHTLSNISNVRLQTLKLSEVFRDTPLHKLFKSKKFERSAYPIHHLSDACRLAIVWKLGGMYLDTDIITLRALDGLQNTLGLEYDEDVTNGVLFFEKHHVFVNACMSEFADDYRPSSWSYQGPELITRMLKKTCKVQELAKVINVPESCQGIRLLPQHDLLPISWWDWRTIVSEKDLGKFNLTGSYMVHFYGSLSHKTTVETGSGVLLDVLARENCPQVYRLMMKNKKF